MKKTLQLLYCSIFWIFFLFAGVAHATQAECTIQFDLKTEDTFGSDSSQLPDTMIYKVTVNGSYTITHKTGNIETVNVPSEEQPVSIPHKDVNNPSWGDVSEEIKKKAKQYVENRIRKEKLPCNNHQ